MISVRTSLAPRVTVRGVVSSVVMVTTLVTASVTSEVERMAGGEPRYRLARLATGASEGTILTALKCEMLTVCHNHDLSSPVECGGQGVKWRGGGDKVEQSLDTVVGGGLGHNIVLRHCLVNLRAPGIQVLGGNTKVYTISPTCS